MVLDYCWIIWINLSSSVVDENRLFMKLMHLSRVSDTLSWIWTFLVAVFFSVTFFASSFSLLFSANCLHCDRLTSVRHIPKVESWFLLVAASSFSSFIFFWLSIIINYLFISWRVMTVRFRTASYASDRRRISLYCCWMLPFAWMVTIGLLVLVVSNLIGASVSFEILLVPFEYFWMEATHDCIFVIMLGGIRGGRWILANLSLMMFLADSVKVYHEVSTSPLFVKLLS